jgi:Secretion system C-terminal sorting domain/PKD domain/PKD-like domain/Ig-like domain CHU_C associated
MKKLFTLILFIVFLYPSAFSTIYRNLLIDEMFYNDSLCGIQDIWSGAGQNCENTVDYEWQLKRDGTTVASASGVYGQGECLIWHFDPEFEAAQEGYEITCDNEWTVYFEFEWEETGQGSLEDFVNYSGTVDILEKALLNINNPTLLCTSAQQTVNYVFNGCVGNYNLTASINGSNVTIIHDDIQRTIVITTNNANTQTAELTVTATCTNYPELSISQTVDIPILGNPQVISGDIEGQGTITTFGVPYIYTISGTSVNSTSHTWSIEPVNSYNSFTVNNDNQITVFWSNTFNGEATISVHGSNSCQEGVDDTYIVTIESLPYKATKPSGTTSVCENGANESYSTSAILATSYNWILSPDTAGTISGGETAIVDWANNFFGTATIMSQGVNANGTGTWSDPLPITVNPLPKIPSIPTGFSTACQDDVNFNFMTSGSLYATSYSWWITDAAGSVSGVGTTSIVDWAPEYFGTADLKVKGINTCGESAYSEIKSIVVSPLPTQPNIPIGETEVCQLGFNTYTVSGDLYSTSWNWYLLPVNSGTIQINGANTVTIDWDENYTGNMQLKVLGINDCGDGEYSNNLAMHMNPLPLRVETPTGETTPCQGQSYIYSTIGATYGTSFSWEVIPSEAATLTENDKSCTIEWSESYSGNAILRVVAHNDCGDGEYSYSLSVDVQPLPLKSGKPSGNIEVCQGVETTNYTTSGATYAIDYDWTIEPLNPAHNVGSIVGNATNAIVYWASDFVGDARIFVMPNNSCGDGIMSDTLIVTKKPLPVKPTTPIGEIDVCENSGEYFYTISPIENATSIEWNLNPIESGEIIGSGTSITLKLDENYSGFIRLSSRGINACDFGEWSEDLIITVRPLPVVSLNTFNIQCSNGTPFALTGGYPTGGYYSWLSEIITNFDPATAGIGEHTISYTVIDAYSCENTASKAITILDYPETPVIKDSYDVLGQSYVYGTANNILKIDVNEPSDSYFWYNDPSTQNLIATGSYMYSAILPNSTNNLLYYLKAYNGNCYSDVKTIMTKSVIKPSTPTIFTDDIVCRGDDVRLIADRDNAPTIDYIYQSVWYDSDLNKIHTGDTLDIVYNVEERIYLATLDSINLTNTFYTNLSDKTNVLIDISDVAKPNVIHDDEYCKYSDITLTATSSGNSIRWYDYNYIFILESDNLDITHVTEDQTYFVASKDGENCESEFEQVDINIQNLEADFSSDVVNISIGGKVNFINNSINAEFYKWNFGDGSNIVSTSSPDHYFYSSGSFDIQLIVKSDIECLDTLTRTNYITVTTGSTGIEESNIEYKIYPNPFRNSFVIENLIGDEVKIVVYNLTGKKVFETISNKSKVFIDITEQSLGLYFVEIMKDEQKTVRKLIKL